MVNSEKIEFRPKELEPTPSYVLSWDVPVLMNALCRYKGWKPPSADVYRKVQTDLTEELEKTIRPVPLTVLNAEIIQKNIQTDVARVKQLGYPIVSLDPIYGADEADACLNITRGLNADFSIAEIARPGYPDIITQIQQLNYLLGDKRDICVIDVGAYSGGSLVDLAQKLAKENIKVNTAVLGIATDESIRTLRSNGILTITKTNIGTPVDWIEARDFIPFVPLSGRVINEPLTSGKLSRAFPYIAPDASKEQMAKWASISSVDWWSFSCACWNMADKIYENMEEQNFILIRPEDLVDLPIRVSSPGLDEPGLTVRKTIKNKEQRLLNMAAYWTPE